MLAFCVLLLLSLLGAFGFGRFTFVVLGVESVYLKLHWLANVKHTMFQLV